MYSVTNTKIMLSQYKARIFQSLQYLCIAKHDFNPHVNIEYKQMCYVSYNRPRNHAISKIIVNHKLILRQHCRKNMTDSWADTFRYASSVKSIIYIKHTYVCTCLQRSPQRWPLLCSTRRIQSHTFPYGYNRRVTPRSTRRPHLNEALLRSLFTIVFDISILGLQCIYNGILGP